MKYICKECPKPCEIIVEDGSDTPMCCPYRLQWHAVNWHEAAENLQPDLQDKQDKLQDKPLPKLTAEVFDRPDCPEWATYAAVHNGNLIFTDQEPGINEHGLFVSASDAARIDKILIVPFKSSEHYLPQFIERPVKKNTLPDWVEVGGYVFDPTRGYGKIIAGSVNTCHIQFECMEASFLPEDFAGFKQARLRPYNAEEVPKLPFEVSEINSDFRTIVVSCKGDKVWLGGASTAISTEELLREFTLDGYPCGILEHLENGEWVE